MARSKVRYGMGSLAFGAIIGAAALAPGLAQATEPANGGMSHRLPFYARPTHFPGEIRPAAGGGSIQLVYMNGPVISEPQIVVVYWGATSSTAKTFATGFFPAVIATPFIDQLSEYNTPSSGTNQKIVRGSYLNVYPITPTTSGATGTTVDDAAVGPEIVSQIGAGHLPAPVYDAQGYSRTLYFIYYAPGITVTLQGSSSCQAGGFCGYHSSTAYAAAPAGKNQALAYASIPDMGAGSGCDTGCASAQGGSAETDTLGETSSHELAEAITDMDVGENNVGWYDNTNGEIGDICDTGGSSATGVGGVGTIGGYTCQFLWSNKNNDCELTDPSIGPQGGCTTNANCSGTTPVCKTTGADGGTAGGGACVGCVANTDCSGSTPICNTTTNTCRACSGNTDCSAPTPVCDVPTSSGDAGASDAGSTDPNAGKCVQCGTSSDCTASAPVCTAGTCGGCTSSSQCTSATDNTCNTTTGACGPAPVSSSSSGGGSGGGSGSGSGSGGGSEADGGGSGNGFGGGSPGSSSGCNVADPGSPASGLGIVGVLFGLALAIGRGKRKNRA